VLVDPAQGSFRATDAGRLMLTIMGGIAEFERGLIRKRTDEGIERARKQPDPAGAGVLPG